QVFLCYIYSMKTIGLVVLIMVAQASPPLPRQTPKSSGQDQSAESHDSSRDKQISANRAAFVPINPQTATSQISKNDNQSAVGSNPKEPISVNPVEVKNVKKDTWDYIYILANIIIALVTLTLAFIAK